MGSRTGRVRTLCTLALTIVLAGALLAGLLLPWVGGPGARRAAVDRACSATRRAS